MADLNHAVAAHWGDVVRRARQALGLRQVDVAQWAELSRNLISRMELGAGGSIPLRSWASVASVLDIRLDAVSHADARWMAPIERRCHAFVAEIARDGGWSAVTEIGPRFETVLVRPQRFEAAVVRTWHPVPIVSAALDEFEERISLESARRGDAWRVSGLILVPRTGQNRRRITERAADIAPRLPADGADWIGSLRGLRQSMPTDRGLVWLDRWATRFTPARRRPGWQ
jgi:transcriptional regulator with XRE-family HTH domain